MDHTKSKNEDCTSKETNGKQRLRVQVGREWDEPLDVSISPVPESPEDNAARLKEHVVLLLTRAFLILLGALTTYAMYKGNGQTLGEILMIAKLGLLSVGIWATGKSVLRVLSGWRDQL